MSVSIWTVIGQFFTLIIFALFLALIVGIPLLLYRMYRRQGEIVNMLREREARESASSTNGPGNKPQHTE